MTIAPQGGLVPVAPEKNKLFELSPANLLVCQASTPPLLPEKKWAAFPGFTRFPLNEAPIKRTQHPPSSHSSHFFHAALDPNVSTSAWYG